MNRLAIIDWGIGGASIYKLIKKQLGDIPVVYFSDTGATPYGKMTRADLVSRLGAVISFLESRGVTHLVIGCNAASTAIPYLKGHGLKIEGMIETAVAETVKYRPARPGLIGGRRTVLSGVYRKAFARHGLKIEQRIAQPLSGLIESGDLSSERLFAETERILRPLVNCSHILLACTHYPAILPVLKRIVSPEVVFIDPADALVTKIALWNLDCAGKDEFFTSGDPKSMKKSARLAFGVDIESVSVTRF